MESTPPPAALGQCVCVCVCVGVGVCVCGSCESKKSVTSPSLRSYGVASIGRFLNIIVSFAKEHCKRDCILQKRPIISRSLLIVATQKSLDHVWWDLHSYGHDITHFYVWYAAYAYVTWLIRMCEMCDMTYLYVTWLTRVCDRVCDMTHIHMWHDSFVCVKCVM